MSSAAERVYQNVFRGGKNGFAQIYSRIGKRLMLGQPLQEDVRVIAEAFGIASRPEVALLVNIHALLGSFARQAEQLERRVSFLWSREAAIAAGPAAAPGGNVVALRPRPAEAPHA